MKTEGPNLAQPEVGDAEEQNHHSTLGFASQNRCCNRHERIKYSIIYIMSKYYQKIGDNYYDLNTIFLPFTSGTKSTTNFKNSDGVDLGSVFQPYSNQLTNLIVNYGFKDLFQSRYFRPKATCSISSTSTSATISITAAAFNSLAITGSGTATITGVSGTSSYSQSFTGLNPDSNYSYTCKPSNTGSSPAATTTVYDGSSTTIPVNTLPLIKGVSASPASANWITILWGATNQSDCSYSYVTVGRATTSGGAITLLTLDSVTNKVSVTDTISAGTTYYYTVTPYNKSNIAGTAVTVSATSFLNTTIDTFSFSSISGLSSTTGWIAFNVKISNFTYATLTTGTTIVEIYQTTELIQKAIQFNTAVSVQFTLSVYNSPDGLQYNGSTTPLTRVITYTRSAVTSVPADNANTFGYFYWLDVILVGSGGGGGGGSKRHGGGNGGGGGSGGYISYSENIDSIGQKACRGYNKSVGIASLGGLEGDGDGSSGYYGPNGDTSISFFIGPINYYFKANCGIGGKGGTGEGNSGYYPNNNDGTYFFGETGGITATKAAVALAVYNHGVHALQNVPGAGMGAGKLGLTNNAGDGGNGSAGYGGSGARADNGNPGLCSFALYYLST